MAKKHINSSSGVVIGSYSKTKAKPKTPYKEPQWLRDYRLKRDRAIWLKATPERRLEIEEDVEFMKKQWKLQDGRL